MTPLVALLAGFIGAVGLVRLAHGADAQRAHRVYAIGLVVASVIYVAFAAVGGANGRWLGVEAAGLALYGAAARTGLRRWPLLLAFGWAAHVAWDILLHLEGGGAAYTPTWYPWLCVSFDLVLAVAVPVNITHRTTSK